MTKRTEYEFHEQCKFYNWCVGQLKQPLLAGIETIYSIPNGAHLRPGQGMKLKKEGLRVGIPDLCLPVPKLHYHSLYIEMKRQEIRTPDGKSIIVYQGETSEEQLIMHEKLRAQGHCVEVCYGKDEAIDAVLRYFGVKQLCSGKVVE